MMLGRSALLGCALALGLVTGPLPAQGQDNPAYEEAKGRAAEAFKAGRYEEAAQYFREAFEAEPRGNLLYNIGLCYEKAGDTRQAIAFYQRFVDAVPGSPKRPALVGKIAEMKQSLAGDYVEVQVTTRPGGATIFVDDKAKGAMGAAPVDFKLLPGTYTIIAEIEGHEPARQQVRLEQGRPAAVDLVLLPTNVVGSVLLVIAEKGAEVKVDGKVVGRTPLEGPLRLRQGPHTVTVSKPGFAPVEKQIEVKAGGDQRVSIDLSGEDVGALDGGGGPSVGGSGGGPGFWPWVVVGAGAAAIGGAVFTGLSAQSLHDQLADKEANGELLAESDIDTGNSLVLTTNVLYGVGAAAIVGGLAWWYFGNDDPLGTRGGVRAAFGAGPDGAPTVQVLGTF